MNEAVKETKEREISIAMLWAVVKKFWIILLIATVVCGIVAGAYSMLFKKDTYSATFEFKVVNVYSQTEYIADTMINAGAKIASECVEIVAKDAVLDPAIKEGGLDTAFDLNKHETKKYIASMLSAKKSGEDSAIFSVTVTSLDPETTLAVAKAVQTVLPDIATDMNTVLTADEGNNISTSLKSVTVVEDANDVRTNSPSLLKYLVMGAAAAFVIAYAICLIIFINDTVVYGEQTITDNFSAPVLGLIPEWDTEGDDKSKKGKGAARNYSGKIIDKDTPFGVSEAFNTLRTNICYSGAGAGCRVYGVTSDFASAGKSVISANIAISLANIGKKVLLVECDLRKPALAKLFKIDERAGLSEYLSGIATDIDSVIHTDVYNGVSIMFSGKTPPNPSELLGSRAMSDAFELLKSRFDFIIVDTPPAFEVTDICTFMDSLDGTVIVARSRFSDINAIKTVVNNIANVNGKIIGFVLNDVNFKSHMAYKSGSYKYKNYKKYAEYTPGLNEK